MTEIAKSLTTAEAEVLADCEETISHGLQTFVEVGTALALIRDNRLYRADFGTFDAYCAERWGFTDRRARQIIEAAEIGRILPVANAGQAAELARVPADERADVLAVANLTTGGKPTAAAIRDAYAASRPSQPAAQPAEADAQLTAQLEEASAESTDRRLPVEAGDGAGELRGAPAPQTAADEGDRDTASADASGEEEFEPFASVRAGAAPAPSRGGEGAGVTPIEDPEEIERQHRIRSSKNVAESLVSLLLRLDPDPIRWLTNTWQPDAFPNRDLPRVRDAFTVDGLRRIAKHIDSIADHLDHNGGSL